MGLDAGDIVEAPGDPAVEVFTANGTWTKPNGVRAFVVEVVGGGGAGGGVDGAGSGVGVGGG
ncbi:MAG TPA: hypothetical protein VJP77_07810, partial [Planctomycetota bacterium]|nr:hypothetical protein [Planctomycetota bacterium]